ncbi:MAG: DUF975 family protein [Bacillus sp. (in: firmicutes)]
MAYAIKNTKQVARESLKGKWGLAIGVYFLFSIIYGLVDSMAQKNYLVFLLLLIFVIAPLSVGYLWFYQDVERGEQLTFTRIFSAFSADYGRNLTASVLVSVYTMLWSLLLIVPGIIKGLSYSMTFFIMRDHPELSPNDAIKESMKMMNGNKMDLFKLALSFLGWIILPFILLMTGTIILITSLASGVSVTALTASVALTGVGGILVFGISLYVTPYFFTSLAAFYDMYVMEHEVTEAE